MQCVKCNHDTRVLQTRETRRRRECLACGHRFTTVEQLIHGALSGGAERKEPKPKVVKAVRVHKAKEALVARKKARDEIERRRWEKESDWDAEDNNFLPDRW